MTSLVLLLWISLGIALQLAIYGGIIFWRYWQNYRVLPAGNSVIATTPAGSSAWSGSRTFRVVRKQAEDAGQSVFSFYLEPEDGQALPLFLPGQFLTFRLDIPASNGNSEPVSRCYSLSDAPGLDGYRVTIKRISAQPDKQLPAGRVSGYFHDCVEAGSLLNVRAPAGGFYLNDAAAPVVLIAGGIGITPMLSMLNWSLREHPGREIWLFYGARDGADVVMRSHLLALAAQHPAFHLRLCFSVPRPNDLAGRDYHHAQRVTGKLLRLELPLKPYHFYLCGPGAMMESLVPELHEWGVKDARIHFEAFGPASVKLKHAANQMAAVAAPSSASAEIQVSFSKSGKQLAWSPASGNLLDFAEAHGVKVDSGCRAGCCGGCQTRIRSGEVAYQQPPEHVPESGTCLLCVCTPKTSITLEA